MDTGAGMRRLLAVIAIAAAAGGGRLRAATRRTSRPSPATPTRRSGRPGRRPSSSSDWISARQHLPPDHRRLPAEPVTPPSRASRWATPTFEEGGIDQRPPRRRRRTGSSSPSTRPTPRAITRSSRSARPTSGSKNGPDRDQTDTREALDGVPAAPRPLPPVPLRRAGARPDHRGAPEPRPLRVHGRLLLPEDARGSAAPPSPATRLILKDYPDYKSDGRGPVPALASASRRRAAAPRPCPTSSRLLEEYPNSPFADAGEAAHDGCGLRPAGPFSRPHRRHPRPLPAPPASPSPDPVSSSVTLETAKKLLTRQFFSC